MIGMEGNSGCIVERRAEAEGLLKSPNWRCHVVFAR